MNWMYIALGLIVIGSGLIYLMNLLELSMIIGLMNLGIIIVLFLRVRQILKNHEKEISKPRESRADEETIKTLIRLQEENKKWKQ